MLYGFETVKADSNAKIKYNVVQSKKSVELINCVYNISYIG